jgi:penicillin-binding protein 2
MTRRIRITCGIPRAVLAAVLFPMLTAAFLAGFAAAGSPGESGQQSALEARAAHIMNGRAGAALLLGVDSGQLLAIFNAKVAAQTIAAPGSAVKPFTLLALIESGKLAANDRLLCPRRLEIAGKNLDCSHRISAQAFDARAALAWSCNNWFVRMAQRLDPQELRGAFVKAGFTARTGLVEGEAVGELREAATTEDLQLQAVGADNVAVTPLELAAAYRRLALLRRDPAAAEKFSAVFEGLEDSVTYGMGRDARIPDAPPLAGKTGTAGSGKGWTHAWFAGYWPAAKPEVVVVVFLERGRGGPDAAPIARDLVAYYHSSKPVTR